MPKVVEKAIQKWSYSPEYIHIAKTGIIQLIDLLIY